MTKDQAFAKAEAIIEKEIERSLDMLRNLGATDQEIEHERALLVSECAEKMAKARRWADNLGCPSVELH